MIPNTTLTIDGSPVLSAQSGNATGETVYRTADGRVWRNIEPWQLSNLGTGETVGRIEPRKEKP